MKNNRASIAPTTRFSLDKKGAIAPMFALMLTCLMGFMAMAVDYSKAVATRTKLHAATDAAALAAASTIDSQLAITTATALLTDSLTKNNLLAGTKASSVTPQAAAIAFAIAIDSSFVGSIQSSSSSSSRIKIRPCLSRG